jgi:hypothetical protein
VGRGARSIRGALGAYLTASVFALASLALVLWLGWPSRDASTVELAADSAWIEAALDDGRLQFSVRRGASAEVPPGSYRLTLLSSDGSTESRAIDVGAGRTRLR